MKHALCQVLFNAWISSILYTLFEHIGHFGAVDENEAPTLTDVVAVEGDVASDGAGAGTDGTDTWEVDPAPGPVEDSIAAIPALPPLLGRRTGARTSPTCDTLVEEGAGGTLGAAEAVLRLAPNPTPFGRNSRP